MLAFIVIMAFGVAVIAFLCMTYDKGPLTDEEVAAKLKDDVLTKLKGINERKVKEAVAKAVTQVKEERMCKPTFRPSGKTPYMPIVAKPARVEQINVNHRYNRFVDDNVYIEPAYVEPVYFEEPEVNYVEPQEESPDVPYLPVIEPSDEAPITITEEDLEGTFS